MDFIKHHWIEIMITLASAALFVVGVIYFLRQEQKRIEAARKAARKAAYENFKYKIKKSDF